MIFNKFFAASAVAASLLAATPAFAASGIFSSFIVLSINSGTNTFYDLSSTTTNPDFAGANLGTFNPAAGNSLTLKGGEISTFKNGASNVTGAFTNYNIHLSASPQGTFTSVNLPFNADLGSNGDQRWQQTASTIDLLASLSPGTYSFEVFSNASTNEGPIFASNNGNNYIATFTVVPEPSATFVSAIGALGLGLCLWRSRRRMA